MRCWDVSGEKMKILHVLRKRAYFVQNTDKSNGHVLSHSVILDTVLGRLDEKLKFRMFCINVHFIV